MGPVLYIYIYIYIYIAHNHMWYYDPISLNTIMLMNYLYTPDAISRLRSLKQDVFGDAPFQQLSCGEQKQKITNLWPYNLKMKVKIIVFENFFVNFYMYFNIYDSGSNRFGVTEHRDNSTFYLSSALNLKFSLDINLTSLDIRFHASDWPHMSLDCQAMAMFIVSERRGLHELTYWVLILRARYKFQFYLNMKVRTISDEYEGQDHLRFNWSSMT